jgi:hypothetical protein
MKLKEPGFNCLCKNGSYGGKKRKKSTMNRLLSTNKRSDLSRLTKVVEIALERI